MLKRLFLICIVAFLTVNSFSLPKVKITSVKCSSSMKFVKPGFKCFAKSLSRHVSTGNMEVHLLTPLKQIFVRISLKLITEVIKVFFQLDIELSHRSGIRPIYNFVFNQTIDFCALMKGTNNIIGRAMIDLVKDTIAKGFFHPCPYSEMISYNVSFKSIPIFAQFLSGRFKINQRVFNDDDDRILNIILEFELV